LATAPITLRYELTAPEYVEAWRLHLLGHYARPMNVIMIGALATMAYMQWRMAPGQSFSIGLIVAVLALVGFRAYTYLRLPHLRLKKVPDLLESHEVTIDEAQVKLKTRLVDAAIPWADFRNFRETHDLFILYKGPNAYLPMPKRALGGPERVEALRALLASKLRQG
jgi:hypothetical protein